MKQMNYSITMSTPIGNKYGTSSIRINQNMLSGTFNLLDKVQPFEGIIKEDGHCLIRGHLKSLIKTIEYTAEGTISRRIMHLYLRNSQHTFEINGEFLSESEDDE